MDGDSHFYFDSIHHGEQDSTAVYHYPLQDVSHDIKRKIERTEREGFDEIARGFFEENLTRGMAVLLVLLFALWAMTVIDALSSWISRTN